MKGYGHSLPWVTGRLQVDASLPPMARTLQAEHTTPRFLNPRWGLHLPLQAPEDRHCPAGPGTLT